MAREIGLTLPNFPDLGLEVREVGVREDGDARGLVYSFAGKERGDASVMVKLTPYRQCVEGEGQPALVLRGIPVYRWNSGSLVGYEAFFESRGTFVEVSVNWLEELAPPDDEARAYFARWLPPS